jgi:monovalent cation/hydrogen antiporter
MLLFEWVLALLLAAIVLTTVAGRLGAPYPSLLAIAGAALAFLPFAPNIRIDPELALALFVAPALVDSAYDTSPRDLRRNLIPIVALAVLVVALTTAAVAYLGWRYAGLPIGAAIALGAIVAPPDASAAGAVLRELRLPQRLGLVLQGESLLNDATALLIYRAAIIATAGSFSLLSDGPLLLLAAAGSVVAGYLFARVYWWATAWASDIPCRTILQFVSTFGVWLLADKLRLSPIIAVVTYAMVLAQDAPRISEPRQRVSSYSVWETAVFIVNVMAFVLMGLQARNIIERLSEEQRWTSLLFGLGVLATVIIVRIIWVASFRTVILLTKQWFSPQMREAVVGSGIPGSIVVSWSGMRGLVTLATAFALPDEFPRRDLIVLCAFCVVLGTLVIQGLTLGPLLRWLRLEDDGTLERDISQARVVVMQAALDSLEGEATPEAAALREQYGAARKVAQNECEPQAATEYDRLRMRAIADQRQALHRLRAQGRIGDEAFHRIEEELDWAELDAAPAGRFQPLLS